MKIKTKYVGTAYSCRRCGQYAGIRIWWFTPYQQKFYGVIHVAYFCSAECAAKHLDNKYLQPLFGVTKQDLLIKITTGILSGELTNVATR